MDPHHFDADPDSPYHPDADPDSNFYLLRFPIRIFIDSDTDLRNKVSNLWKSAQIGSYSIHFGLSSAQIDADPAPDPAYHFDADPDADLDPDFYLMRMRIHADPDPQHWQQRHDERQGIPDLYVIRYSLLLLVDIILIISHRWPRTWLPL